MNPTEAPYSKEQDQLNKKWFHFETDRELRTLQTNYDMLKLGLGRNMAGLLSTTAVSQESVPN